MYVHSAVVLLVHNRSQTVWYFLTRPFARTFLTLRYVQVIDHVSPLLRQLHWLKVREWIDFRLALLVYKCQHGAAPSDLADDLSQLADLEDRCRLHSASSPLLIARCTWLSTIDDRTFSVTAACVWNRLPQHVISAPSLSVCLPQPPVDTPLQALLSSTVTAIVTIVPEK